MTCRGEGKVSSDPCLTCFGNGITKDKKNLNIVIPAGFLLTI